MVRGSSFSQPACSSSGGSDEDGGNGMRSGANEASTGPGPEGQDQRARSGANEASTGQVHESKGTRTGQAPSLQRKRARIFRIYYIWMGKIRTLCQKYASDSDH